MNTLELTKVSNAKKLANRLFPNHQQITESYYNDFHEAFMMMGKKFIKDNMSVINESVWTFHFDKTFFCIVLNPGEQTEELYYGTI
jgi:hypothetical protein